MPKRIARKSRGKKVALSPVLLPRGLPESNALSPVRWDYQVIAQLVGAMPKRIARKSCGKKVALSPVLLSPVLLAVPGFASPGFEPQSAISVPCPCPGFSTPALSPVCVRTRFSTPARRDCSAQQTGIVPRLEVLSGYFLALIPAARGPEHLRALLAPRSSLPCKIETAGRRATPAPRCSNLAHRGC